ncbi:unnamed protein product [Onchocerca flexuosa]|uniref:Uncharacterized protein n=1 Tax=Onchocerca flexuosa TaxID=387005 RepID=A0A183H6I3_9BILA|nr:unnamed protein product [Onchocerca flexuosa]
MSFRNVKFDDSGRIARSKTDIGASAGDTVVCQHTLLPVDGYDMSCAPIQTMMNCFGERKKKAMSSSSLSSSRHRAQSDPTKLPLLTFRNPSVSCVWNICLLRLRCDKSRIKFGFLRSIHVRIDVDFNDRSVRRSHCSRSEEEEEGEEIHC